MHTASTPRAEIRQIGYFLKGSSARKKRRKKRKKTKNKRLSSARSAGLPTNLAHLHRIVACEGSSDRVKDVGRHTDAWSHGGHSSEDTKRRVYRPVQPSAVAQLTDGILQTYKESAVGTITAGASQGRREEGRKVSN